MFLEMASPGQRVFLRFLLKRTSLHIIKIFQRKVISIHIVPATVDKSIHLSESLLKPAIFLYLCQCARQRKNTCFNLNLSDYCLGWNSVDHLQFYKTFSFISFPHLKACSICPHFIFAYCIHNTHFLPVLHQFFSFIYGFWVKFTFT